MSAVAERKKPIESGEQMSFDFSAVMQQAIQTPFRRKSELEEGCFSEANLLEKSSVELGVKTKSLLVGESSTDVTLDEAQTLFLNNNGYIIFALQALYIAARDMMILDLVGGRENATQDQLYMYATASLWLDGEPSPFPFVDCVKLLDYELRFQNAGKGAIPDIANNPQVIRNWIKNDPKKAVHYLGNYQSLFKENHRSNSVKEDNYNDLLASAKASEINANNLTPDHYATYDTGEQQYERSTP